MIKEADLDGDHEISFAGEVLLLNTLHDILTLPMRRRIQEGLWYTPTVYNWFLLTLLVLIDGHGKEYVLLIKFPPSEMIPRNLYRQSIRHIKLRVIPIIP